jgi:hypothetical protein
MPFKLKERILKWLGIPYIFKDLQRLDRITHDLVSIGVDVQYKEQSTIIILSHLNGGQVRQIPAHFKDLAELEQLIKGLKCQYNTSRDIWDMPFGFHHGGEMR